VRLLLLTARPELETNRRLAEAARSEGIEALVVDATELTAHTGRSSALRYRGEDLLEHAPGAVLARVGNWRPDSVLAALETLVSAGVPTPNSPAAIRCGRDHWRTARVLAEAGLPVPTTLAGADPERLAAAAADAMDFPVVVKQRRSRMGVGVIRCTARDQLDAVLDSLWRVGDELIVQQYLESGGVSLRLLVVGDEVVAAVRLHAPDGDWRSNAARGGVAEDYRPTDAELGLARDGARALGLELAGVDLLPGNETSVVEINPTPGFLRLESATGVDVAAAIVRHLIDRVAAGW
jgi:RimK family alpha-L-glutamate ligase